jgi:hypothetical protein
MYIHPIFPYGLSALLAAFKLAGLHDVSWWLVFAPLLALFAVRVVMLAVGAWITWLTR